MKRFFLDEHGEVLIIFEDQNKMPAFIKRGSHLSDDSSPTFVSLEGNVLKAKVEIGESLPEITLKEIEEFPVSWKNTFNLYNIPIPQKK